MSSNGYFGIRIGNTSACIALNKDKVSVVANHESGDFVTPMMLALLDDGTHVVGLPAKQQLSRNAQACASNPLQVLSYKSELGDEVFNVLQRQCGGNLRQDEDNIRYLLKRDDEQKEFNATTVLKEIFINLNSIANHAAHLPKCSVVISVPYGMSQKNRRDIYHSAQESGFEVLQIISNPSAACMAYDLLQTVETEANILVYRMGGMTSDVTLLRLSNGLLSILDNVAETDLGGKQLTEVLVKYIAKEFYQKYKLDPNESRKTMAKLTQYAENTKHILSSMQSAQISIESLMDGVDFTHNLSRARFESLIASTTALYKKPVEKLLDKLGNTQIDQIILCGGGMKVPKVRSEITSMFPNAKILTGLSEDEILAIGCAKQANVINRQFDTHQEFIDMEINILPVDVILKLADDDEEIEIFKSGSLVPASTKFNIDFNNKIQKNLKFNIYEKGTDGLNLVGEIALDDEIDNTDVTEFIAKLNTNGVQIEVI